jgi:hypothetical protein
MATRASIKFSDKDGNFIANVYHHYDGYPEYLGAKLEELTGAPIVNGLTMNPDGTRPELGEVFNGMGCLVASVVAKLKEQPGMVYLYTEDDFGQCGEDYLYEVIENSESNGAKVFIKNMDGEWEFVEDILNRVAND